MQGLLGMFILELHVIKQLDVAKHRLNRNESERKREKEWGGKENLFFLVPLHSG